MVKKIFSPLFILFSVVFIKGDSLEKPIAVIVPSYNNNKLFEGKELYKWNLDSIFSQEYDNYRVIIVDDRSRDGTAPAVKNYVRQSGQQHRVIIVENSTRWGPSRNRYVAAHMCDDDEIVCVVDGDDWLADSTILSQINELYTHNDIWVTYSGMTGIPGYSYSGAKEVPAWVVDINAYRQYGWYYHSLRTFYAWLFKQVALKDLLYDGYFFPISSDLAEMFPLMEMSGGRFAFMPGMIYMHSEHPTNEINDQGVDLMVQTTSHIRYTMQPYGALKEKETVSITKDPTVEVCILSNNQDTVSAVSRSCETFLSGVSNIHVVPCISDMAMKDAVMHTLSMSSAEYMVLISDASPFVSGIAVKKMVQELERIRAHAIHFDATIDFDFQRVCPYQHSCIDVNHPGQTDPLYAFQYKKMSDKECNKKQFLCALYRRSDLVNIVSSAHFDSLDTFSCALLDVVTGTDAVGLFCGNAKV